MGDNINPEEQLNLALAEAKKNKYCEIGGKVVTIYATNEETPEETNIMKIMSV